MRTPTDEDVEKVWRNFWVRDCFGEKEPTLDQIKLELFDYRQLLEEVSIVYMAVTGGMVSKPNTLASVVLGFFEEKFMWKDDCGEEEE